MAIASAIVGADGDWGLLGADGDWGLLGADGFYWVELNHNNKYLS